MSNLETLISRQVDTGLSGTADIENTLLKELLNVGLSNDEILYWTARRRNRHRSIVRKLSGWNDEEKKLIRRLRNIPDKTLVQRLYKIRRSKRGIASGLPVARDEKKPAVSSDHLFRTARIMAHAIRVFGENRKALLWLRRQNAALKNQVPIELVRTDAGAYAVEEVLHRIEFGIFS